MDIWADPTQRNMLLGASMAILIAIVRKVGSIQNPSPWVMRGVSIAANSAASIAISLGAGEPVNVLPLFLGAVTAYATAEATYQAPLKALGAAQEQLCGGRSS